MKELGDIIYSMTAFVQHLIREESLQATILLIIWRTPAATIADHVIAWNENYGVRLECRQLLKTET